MRARRTPDWSDPPAVLRHALEVMPYPRTPDDHRALADTLALVLNAATAHHDSTWRPAGTTCNAHGTSVLLARSGPGDTERWVGALARVHPQSWPMVWSVGLSETGVSRWEDMADRSTPLASDIFWRTVAGTAAHVESGLRQALAVHRRTFL